MTNSVGESRHVGHSMIHFNSIYFYAVISLIVQIHAHMHTCDKPFEYQSFKSIYIYIYIYTYIYILQLAFITDHSHISIPISLSYYLFKDILNLYSFTYTHSCILIHTYSIIYSCTYTHSCILIHKCSFTNTHSRIHFIYSFTYSFTYSYHLLSFLVICDNNRISPNHIMCSSHISFHVHIHVSICFHFHFP